jgi:virulence-associated protein VagC
MIGRAQRFLYEKGNAMKVGEIVRMDGCQLVKLPEEFQLEGDNVSIRRQGESLVLQPIKPATCPLGFFDRIRLDDPAFARPAQGRVPPVPILG